MKHGKGIVDVFDAGLAAEVSLRWGGALSDKRSGRNGQLQCFTEMASKELGLIVTALTSTSAMERHRNYRIKR